MSNPFAVDHNFVAHARGPGSTASRLEEANDASTAESSSSGGVAARIASAAARPKAGDDEPASEEWQAWITRLVQEGPPPTAEAMAARLLREGPPPTAEAMANGAKARAKDDGGSSSEQAAADLCHVCAMSREVPWRAEEDEGTTN